LYTVIAFCELTDQCQQACYEQVTAPAALLRAGAALQTNQPACQQANQPANQTLPSSQPANLQTCSHNQPWLGWLVGWLAGLVAFGLVNWLVGCLIVW